MISPSDCLRNELSLSDCVRCLEGEFRSWWSDPPWWAGWAPLLGGLILVALVSEVRKAARKAGGGTATPERGRRSEAAEVDSRPVTPYSSSTGG